MIHPTKLYIWCNLIKKVDFRKTDDLGFRTVFFFFFFFFFFSAKNTLLDGDCSCPGSGVFLFSALDRLKVGVGKVGDDLFVRMARVLVTSGDVPPVGLGKDGGIAAGPGLPGLTVVVAYVDDIRVVLPDAVICGAGLRGGCCCGVW